MSFFTFYHYFNGTFGSRIDRIGKIPPALCFVCLS